MIERTWIILTTDGRHSTVGRDTTPTADEIAGYAAKMEAQGLAGWVATAEGDYFAKRGRMVLQMVQPLGAPLVSFDDAAALYETARVRSNRRAEG